MGELKYKVIKTKEQYFEHLAGYYHGTPSVGTIEQGMEATQKMLALIA